MSYDLHLRGGPCHTAYVSTDVASETLAGAGLVARTPTRWTTTSNEPWLEVYLSRVAQGPGADALDGPHTQVNLITCHPRPLDHRTMAIVQRVAAELGWEIHDPQLDRRWRDGGPSLALAHLPSEAPTVDHVPGENAKGIVVSLAWREPDQLVVGYRDTVVGGPCGVDLRRADGTSLQGWEDAHPPAVVSADGRRLAMIESDSKELRVVPLDGGAPQRWPVRAAAWLPDWPTALVATTRPPKMRRTTTSITDLPPERAQRLRELERSSSARLVVIDVSDGSIHPLAHVELEGESFHGGAHSVVSGDGEHLLFATENVVHVFSLSDGNLRWRHRYLGGVLTAFAATACGRAFALAGICAADPPGRVVMLDAQDGRVLVSHSARTLGTASYVDALAFHPSGWLASGLGNGSFVEISMHGEVRARSVLRGAVKAIAFSDDGAAWAAGSRSEGFVRLGFPPAASSSRPRSAYERCSAEERATRIRAWRFEAQPLQWLTDVDAILAHTSLSPTAKADRLAAVRNVEGLAALAREKGPVDVLTLAMARSATRAGEHLPASCHAFVGAALASPRLNEDERRELAEAVAEPERDEVLLAPLPVPAWARFGLACSKERAAVALVEMIHAWPKGIWSTLRKRDRLSVPSTSADFWAKASASLLALGDAAVAPLAAALESPSPHRRFLEEHLAILRAQASATSAEDDPALVDVERMRAVLEKPKLSARERTKVAIAAVGTTIALDGPAHVTLAYLALLETVHRVLSEAGKTYEAWQATRRYDHFLDAPAYDVRRAAAHGALAHAHHIHKPEHALRRVLAALEDVPATEALKHRALRKLPAAESLTLLDRCDRLAENAPDRWHARSLRAERLSTLGRHAEAEVVYRELWGAPATGELAVLVASAGRALLQRGHASPPLAELVERCGTHPDVDVREQVHLATLDALLRISPEQAALVASDMAARLKAEDDVCRDAWTAALQLQRARAALARGGEDRVARASEHLGSLPEISREVRDDSCVGRQLVSSTRALATELCELAPATAATLVEWVLAGPSFNPRRDERYRLLLVLGDARTALGEEQGAAEAWAPLEAYKNSVLPHALLFGELLVRRVRTAPTPGQAKKHLARLEKHLGHVEAAQPLIAQAQAWVATRPSRSRKR
jgi:tetratricopeptide (TPR) repeat protein